MASELDNVECFRLRVGARFVVLRGDELVIGRSRYASFVIEDSSVSRVHASVSREGERYVLRDLGSRNGTFLGDRRVGDASVLVQPGDEARFGDVRGRFETATLSRAEAHTVDGLELSRSAEDSGRRSITPRNGSTLPGGD